MIILSWTLAALLAPSEPPREPEAPYLDAARRAAAHLLALRTDSAALRWPVAESEGSPVAANLYHGRAGGLLLLGWLAALDAEPEPGAFRSATKALLEDARPLPKSSGWTWPDRPGAAAGSPGLYTGDAGVGAVLLELEGLTHRPELVRAVHRCTDGILARQVRDDVGGHWSTGTDVISGAAGIGLYLLRVHDRLHRPDALDAARAAARWLVARGEAADPGIRWRIAPSVERIYPNFSHGAAGVGAFLLELQRRSPDPSWLEAGRGAVTYLDGLGTEDPPGCWIWPHHEGDDLQYVSFCHGPPGTARLYELWYRCSGSEAARERVLAGGRWLREAGLPRPVRPLPGYWNVGRCCGAAGVGDFYLDLHSLTGEAAWLEAAREIADYLLEQAEHRPSHRAWRQAEHRVRPEELSIQTGWAQGSAGIGLFLLRLHLVLEDAPLPGWCLPDQPFDPLPTRRPHEK